MNKEQLLAKYGYFDMVQNVTLKAMAQFTDDQLNFRATPEMRTAREILSHMFGAEAAMAEAVISRHLTEGELSAVEGEGVKTKTTAELIEFARQCHRRAKAALEQATEEQLAQPVDAFYGSFPGWQMVMFGYDEHWHHRGQIYTYLRLLGIEPIMLYSYE